MTVAAVVYDEDNEGSAIASTSIDSEGYRRGLLDAQESDALNEHSEIGIEIHRSHPSASAFVPKRVVRLVDDNGISTMFEILSVEETIVGSDASRERLQVKGRSLLWQWRALVEGHRPDGEEPQSDVVAYNFATPGRDLSDMTATAYVQPRSGSGFTSPAFWQDPYSLPVWTNTEDPSTAMGSIFGVRDFTLASDAFVVIKMSADDGFVPWLDGVQFPERKPRTFGTDHIWYSTWNGVVAALEAGTHRFGVEAKNIGGTAALWVSAWRTDAALLGDPLFITGTDEGNPIIGDWKWSAYPSPRLGCPVLMPVVDFHSRAQARGAMSGWSLGFTATADSDSVTVAESEFQIGTDRNGIDLLTAISLDWCDFKVRKAAGKTLDAYVKPIGTATGLEVEEGEVTAMSRKVSV